MRSKKPGAGRPRALDPRQVECLRKDLKKLIGNFIVEKALALGVGHLTIRRALFRNGKTDVRVAAEGPNTQDEADAPIGHEKGAPG